MITSVRSQDLATKIEQVVREYIAAGRQVAKAAVERAFAEAEREAAAEPQRTKPKAKPGRRRTRSEAAERRGKLRDLNGAAWLMKDSPRASGCGKGRPSNSAIGSVVAHPGSRGLGDVLVECRFGGIAGVLNGAGLPRDSRLLERKPIAHLGGGVRIRNHHFKSARGALSACGGQADNTTAADVGDLKSVTCVLNARGNVGHRIMTFLWLSGRPATSRRDAATGSGTLRAGLGARATRDRPPG